MSSMGKWLSIGSMGEGNSNMCCEWLERQSLTWRMTANIEFINNYGWKQGWRESLMSWSEKSSSAPVSEMAHSPSPFSLYSPVLFKKIPFGAGAGARRKFLALGLKKLKMPKFEPLTHISFSISVLKNRFWRSRDILSFKMFHLSLSSLLSANP